MKQVTGCSLPVRPSSSTGPRMPSRRWTSVSKPSNAMASGSIRLMSTRTETSSLRNRGLNAEVWRQWVASVIAHSELLSQVPASPADGRTDPRFLAEVAEFLRRPSSACPGSDGLRGRLDEMWAEYEPTADAWKRAITGPEGVRRMGRPADQRRRWQALQPFHSRVATIQVFLVSYPAPVVMASSPTACLIAPDRDPAAYTQQVVAAAKSLAAAA